MVSETPPTGDMVHVAARPESEITSEQTPKHLAAPRALVYPTLRPSLWSTQLAAAVSPHPPSAIPAQPTAVATVTSPPTATTLTNHASGKVFAIPELLDMILVYVSIDSYNEQNSYARSKPSFPSPAKALFVLQRVNSAFKATIARNKTIQRRMSLAPYPRDSTDVAHPFSQIDWFAKEMVTNIRGVPTHGLTWPRYDYTHLCYDGITIGTHLLQLLRTAPPNPKASWRNMKLHCIEGGAPLEISLLGLFCGVIWKVTYESGLTLGKLCDALLEVLKFKGCVKKLLVCDG